MGAKLSAAIVFLCFFFSFACIFAQTATQCPTCKSYLMLHEGQKDVKCKCGRRIDAAAILARKAAHEKQYEQIAPEEAKRSGCLSCHKGIAIINPKMSFIRSMDGEGKGCVICHEGDAQAHTRNAAHKGMLPNPGNMWAVSQNKGCAKCHSRQASVMPVTSYASGPQGQGNHVYRMERGLMSTTMGILNNTLCANGLLPIGVRKYANVDLDDPLGAVPVAGSETYKKWVAKAIETKSIQYLPSVKRLVTYPQAVKLWGEPKAMLVDYYRKECARCHVWTDGAKARGDRRAGGCTSCHVLYSNDAFYEGDDPTIFKDEVDRPLKHEIVRVMPSVQCTRCHTRGKRIGTSFVGIMEFPYVSPWRKDGTGQIKLHKKRYFHVGPDIHFERGIDCADCHTSIDVHGDGNIYPTTDHAVEIECEDCHGTPAKYPWELPIGYGDAVQLGDEARGLLRTGGKEYVLTARGNPYGNVLRDGEKMRLTDSKGKVHDVPLLKSLATKQAWKDPSAKVAMVSVEHLKKMECYGCHAVWVPQCYGCHLKEDFSGRTTRGVKMQHDWLASSHAHDWAGRTGKVSTPGKLVETRSYLRWERPILGMNKEKRISPVTTGCQVMATFVDKGGNVTTLNKPFRSSMNTYGLAMNPAQPHTVRHEARSCENCHTDPKALGYGIDGGRFGNLAKAHEGDIPGAKRTDAQIPAIDFPYDLSTLITREGKQVQTMSYKSTRPMNDRERDLSGREGLCIGCHQYYNTPEWDKLKKRIGPAATTKQHAEIMSRAIKALMQKK
ncbi:MAG: cytochrome C [Planctomycetes bacterium]|nr:cytochrome C [Planctomycetota bacterium]